MQTLSIFKNHFCHKSAGKVESDVNKLVISIFLCNFRIIKTLIPRNAFISGILSVKWLVKYKERIICPFILEELFTKYICT